LLLAGRVGVGLQRVALLVEEAVQFGFELLLGTPEVECVFGRGLVEGGPRGGAPDGRGQDAACEWGRWEGALSLGGGRRCVE
jgi:hypothetical protein